MLLARIVREGQASWLRVPPLAVIVAGAYYGSALLPQDFRHVASTATPLALLVAAIGAADAMRAQTADDNAGASAGVSAERTIPWPFRVMVLLGEYAFAFFMVHQLILRVVLKLAGPTAVEGHLLAVVGVALLVALAVSWLLHHFVNLPAARLLTRTNP